jgi:hypothetical protein
MFNQKATVFVFMMMMCLLFINVIAVKKDKFLKLGQVDESCHLEGKLAGMLSHMKLHPEGYSVTSTCTNSVISSV